MWYKNNVLVLLINSIIISALIFCFIPLKIVVSNPDHFLGLDSSAFSLYSATLSLVSGLFFFLIFLLLNRISSRLCSKVSIALLGYLVICGLYFSIQSGFNDAVSIPSVSLLTFFLTGIVVIVGSIFFERLSRAIIWAALIGALAAMVMGLHSLELKIVPTQNLHTQGFFDLSTNKKNIILMSFDSLMSSDIQTILVHNPELKKELSGFTFFSHATSVAPCTTLSLPTTALGRIPETNKSRYKAFYKHSKENIMNYLYRKSFNVSEYGCFINTEQNRNILKVPSLAIHKRSQNSYLYALKTSFQRYTFLKNGYFPETANKIIFIITRFMNRSPLSQLEKDAIFNYGIDSFTKFKMQDILQFNYFIGHLRGVKTTKPTAHFMHFFITHPQVTFDQDCHYKPPSSIIQNSSGSLGQTECGVKKLIAFLRKLKLLHVFDNSLVFLVSDHGSGCRYSSTFPRDTVVRKPWCLSRYNPLLMVKPFQEKFQSKKALQENHFEASLVDIAKTVCETVRKNSQACSGYQGVDLLNIKPHDNKENREILFFNKTATDTDVDTYTYYHKVNIGRSHSIIDYYIKPSKTLCGESLQFSQFSDFRKAMGLCGPEKWGRWSKSKTVKIFFKGDLKGCTRYRIKLRMIAYTPKKHPKQHAKVLLNGISIGDINFSYGQEMTKDLIFPFSKKIYKEHGENILTFLIDDPVSPKSMGLSSDDRELGLGFISMLIE